MRPSANRLLKTWTGFSDCANRPITALTNSLFRQGKVLIGFIGQLWFYVINKETPRPLATTKLLDLMDEDENKDFSMLYHWQCCCILRRTSLLVQHHGRCLCSTRHKEIMDGMGMAAGGGGGGGAQAEFRGRDKRLPPLGSHYSMQAKHGE